MRWFNFYFLSFLVGSLFLPAVTWSQGATPLTTPVFQNTNTACEREDVLNNTYTLTCGQFTDDTASGESDFPDCVTVTDTRTGTGAAEDQLSYLENDTTHVSTTACTTRSQFSAAATVTITTPAVANRNISSIVNADFDAVNFNDLVFPLTPLGLVDYPASVEEYYSIVGGGFANGAVDDGTNDTVLNLEDGSFRVSPFLTDPDALAGTSCLELDTIDSAWGGLEVCGADKSSVTHDCNNDSLPDLTTMVVTKEAGGAASPFTVEARTFLNSAGDLSLTPDTVTTVETVARSVLSDACSVASSIAEGDFTGDGINDFVMTVSLSDCAPGSGTDPTGSYIYICEHAAAAGTCTYTCGAAQDLADSVDSTNAQPFSVVAADFDGDGNDDAALSLQGTDGSGDRLSRVLYLFGDGAGAFDATDMEVSTVFTEVGGAVSRLTIGARDFTSMVPTTLTTGNYDNDGITDLAVTNFTADRVAGLCPDNCVLPQSDVIALRSNGTGGSSGSAFSPNVTVLEFQQQTVNANGTLVTTPPDRASGIQTTDFDHCGGDDIVALSEYCTAALSATEGSCSVNETRRASVWLNANEDPVVNAGVDLTIANGATGSLSGTASDPTEDTRVCTWSVTTLPAGATATIVTPTTTLTGATTAVSTDFSADTDGTYTVQLSCVDFCGATTTDTMTVFIGVFRQGGCIASLSPEGGSQGGRFIWALLLLVPALLLTLRYLPRRSRVMLWIVLGVFLTSAQATALSSSISVNTFAPTVDDSEYFTVYSSPTMLRRNFHFGFYLDYARNPYEFGNTNYTRVSGITDHLLSGNIVGSYGVLDYLTVGVRVPFHFWQDLSAPLLGINQNAFNLGDIGLDVKLRLLDRDAHSLGIALVPFVNFPSSTGANQFLGDGGVNGGMKIALDARFKDRISLALNAGYRVRDRFTDDSNNIFDDQFLVGLGVSADVIKDKLKAIGEAQMATVTKHFFTRRTTPAEGRLGLRYTMAKNHDISVGAGLGMSNGVGNPSLRGFAGYTYTKRPIADVEIVTPISEVEVGDEITLEDKIYFEFDKAIIRDISGPTLDKVAGFLKAHPEVSKARIEGHTCDLGSDSHNQKLSERRANAVKDHLAGQEIDAARLRAVGLGEAKPIVANADEPSREQNRRVQIFVEEVAR